MGVSARPKRVRGERERQRDAQWRQRKKNERQQLQETACELETQLAQLQGLQADGEMDVDSSTSQHADDAVPTRKRKNEWQREASVKRIERMKAELLNKSLKQAVVSEQKAFKTLRDLFEKRPPMPRTVIENVGRTICSSTLAQCSQCCNPTTLHVNPTSARMEIRATLQQLHAEANRTLDSTVDDPCLSFNYDIRIDSIAGPVAQVTTMTPVCCRVEDAAKLLGPQHRGRRSIDLGGMRLMPDYFRNSGAARERQFTVELGAPHQTVILNGFGSFYKTSRANQELTLWAAVSFDRCGALCFRERTWLAVVQVSDNESVIQSHYTVSAEKAAGCTVIDGESIDQVRDRTLRAMGKQIQERYQTLQRSVLCKTGRVDLVEFISA